jgi:hypothetical protein
MAKIIAGSTYGNAYLKQKRMRMTKRKGRF